MPKIFHGPHKNSPASPPTYSMYGPLILSWEFDREATLLSMIIKHYLLFTCDKRIVLVISFSDAEKIEEL